MFKLEIDAATAAAADDDDDDDAYDRKYCADVGNLKSQVC